MNLVRKYKICKLLNDYSSLSEEDKNFIHYLKTRFPINKFYIDARVTVNYNPSYYYDSYEEVLYVDYLFVQQNLETTFKDYDYITQIKIWFSYVYNLNVFYIYNVEKLMNTPLINCGISYNIKI